MLGQATGRQVETLKAEVRTVLRAQRTANLATQLGDSDWRLVLQCIENHVDAEARTVVMAATAIAQGIRTLSPALMIVGNPCTMEGRLAVTMAHQARVPSVCIQHGDIVGGDPLWRAVPIQRVCVWGERSRDALRDCGFAADRIAVTGAPWLDSLQRGPHASFGARTVLVALSGAGHQVGVTEHVETLARIYFAASRMSDVHWVFRLHPKDDAAIYRQVAARVGCPVGTLVESRKTSITIQDQLRTADALLTVTSTAALDAMVQGVPVLSLARAAGENVPAYVEAGATTHVGLRDPLDERTRALLLCGPAPATEKAAREFASRFYGPIDGMSTKRVADELLDLTRQGFAEGLHEE